MIGWFLCGFLFLWCLINRFGEGGKVEEHPLGMPRGTVRALITILIVSFPFIYIINGEEIPGIITNAIFIVVAFYFEARRGKKDRLRVIEEIKYPEETKNKDEIDKEPLYLPKYSVRIILVSLLVIILITNTFGPRVPFEITNTLVDLLIIVVFFIIGTIFGAIKNAKVKKRLTGQVTSIDNYKSQSAYEINANIEKQKKTWWELKGKSILSISTFIAVIISLIFYSINWDFLIPILPIYDFSLRETLLLLISVYYGFRD
ncbi:MAG: hypothetical protein ACFFAU_19090 [Candidatus Hodarchaeota archaeon]